MSKEDLGLVFDLLSILLDKVGTHLKQHPDHGGSDEIMIGEPHDNPTEKSTS